MGWEPKIHPQRKGGKVVAHTFRCGGQVYCLSKNLRQARADAADIRAAQLRKEARPIGTPQFVAELVEMWLARWPKRKWTMLAWTDYAGRLVLDRLPADHLEEYAKSMIEGDYSLWVVRERVNYAYKLCRWAVDHGWMVKAPRKPRISEPQQEERDIPRDRLIGMFDGLPGNAGKVLRFTVETGCRPAEARLLEWNQVDEWFGVARQSAHKTKRSTGASRKIPMTPGAKAILDCQPRTGRWVFPTRLGRPYTAQGLRSVLQDYFPDLTPYQFRHTMAQFLADSDQPDSVIAAVLGHSSTRMVRFYRKVKQDRLARIAAGLASPVPPQPASDLGSVDRQADSAAPSPDPHTPADAPGASQTSDDRT